MKKKNQTSSTGNRIYESLEELLEDRDEPPTFDFDMSEDEDPTDES